MKMFLALAGLALCARHASALTITMELTVDSSNLTNTSLNAPQGSLIRASIMLNEQFMESVTAPGWFRYGVVPMSSFTAGA